MKKIGILKSKHKFDVNNVYCVGKNYFDHIVEFGGNKKPETPVIFLKPNSAITDKPSIIIPEYNSKPISKVIHYEAEFVVAIGKGGINIKPTEAHKHIFGFAAGLDLTLRDIQARAKEQGMPWAAAKGFINSAPISKILPKKMIKDPMNVEIELLINNIRKQFINTSVMIFNIYELIAYISSVFTINKGDLIFTGTPSGVGEIFANDVLKLNLNNKLYLKLIAEF